MSIESLSLFPKKIKQLLCGVAIVAEKLISLEEKRDIDGFILRMELVYWLSKSVHSIFCQNERRENLYTLISTLGTFVEKIVPKNRKFVKRLINKSIANVTITFVAQSTLPIQKKRIADKTISCFICYQYFIKLYHYLQHLRMHYRLCMYECHRCGKRFVQQNGLIYHVNRKKCSKEMRKKVDITYISCYTCKIFIKNGSQLRNHILLKHCNNDIHLGLNKNQLQLLFCDD